MKLTDTILDGATEWRWLRALTYSLWLVVLAGVGATVGCFYVGFVWPWFHIGRIASLLPWAMGATLFAVLALAWWRGTLSGLVAAGVWRAYLWISALLATTIVLFFCLERWRGGHAWGKLTAELKARGETLRAGAVEPPVVAAADDFARSPLFAPLFETSPRHPGNPEQFAPPELKRLRSLRWGSERRRPLWHHPRGLAPFEADWTLQQPSDLIALAESVRTIPIAQSTTEPVVPRSNLNDPMTIPNVQALATWMRTVRITNLTDARTEIRKELATFETEMREISAAANRPYARFPQGWTDANPMGGEYPTILVGLSQLFRVRAVLSLSAAEPQQALRDVHTLLRLVVLGTQQPSAGPPDSITALIIHALQPIWEGLLSRRWSAPQLRELRQELLAIDLMPSCRRNLREHALYNMELIDQLIPEGSPKSPAWFDREEIAGNWLLTAFRLTYPTGWARQNRVAIYRRYEREAAPSRWTQQPCDGPDRLFAPLDPYTAVFLAPRLNEGYYQIRLQFCWAQTALLEAAVATAIESSRLAHGEYPASLNALVPEFLGAIPQDLCRSASLAYRKTDPDAFVLYSVGADGQDDAGYLRVSESGARPRAHLWASGDWIWSYTPRYHHH